MKKYIFAAILAVLVSCTNDIAYKGPGTDPMLVINSQAIANDTLWVKVSHSRFFLDTDYSDKKLSDATVKITIDGEERTATYRPEYKAYSDGRVVRSGNHVKISATHPKYGTVYAEDYVPAPDIIVVKSSTAKYNDKKGKSDYYEVENSDSVWNLKVSIKKSDAAPHYYNMMINAIREISWYEEERPGDGYWYTTCDAVNYCLRDNTKIALGLEDTESILENGFEEEYYMGFEQFVFSDEMLNDQNELSFDIMLYKEFVNYEKIPFGYDPDEFVDTTHYYIKYNFNIDLLTISEAAYQYNKSYNDYEDSEWSLFSEPVQVVSNVNGGLGIFSTMAEHWSQTNWGQAPND